jgi:putative transposase
MKLSRFSEEQIIGILREQEAGAATADVCRKHGISSATFYKWKAKFGGLEVSDETDNGRAGKCATTLPAGDGLFNWQGLSGLVHLLTRTQAKPNQIGGGLAKAVKVTLGPKGLSAGSVE